MSKFGRPSGKYVPHPLKAELERRGFTQQAAALYCGVSRARMCHFLNGSPPHKGRPGRIIDLMDKMLQPDREREAALQKDALEIKAIKAGVKAKYAETIQKAKDASTGM